jgi:hypothetical protein
MGFLPVAKGAGIFSIFKKNICSFGIDLDLQRKLEKMSSGLQVIFIRHGEKPTESDNWGHGVPQGDEYIGLSPNGWDRAKRLPSALSFMAQKNVGVFAMQQSIKGGKPRSRRPIQTVNILADHFTLGINTNFAKGDHTGIAGEILSGKYVDHSVVVCWEHHDLTDVMKAFGVKEPKEGAFTWAKDKHHGETWAFSKIVVFNYDKDGSLHTVELRDQDSTFVEEFHRK